MTLRKDRLAAVQPLATQCALDQNPQCSVCRQEITVGSEFRSCVAGL